MISNTLKDNKKQKERQRNITWKKKEVLRRVNKCVRRVKFVERREEVKKEGNDQK